MFGALGGTPLDLPTTMTMPTTDAVRRQVVLVAAAAATSALLLKSADNLRKRQISRDEEEDHFPVPSGAKFGT